jgi:hypothetical protein
MESKTKILLGVSAILLLVVVVILSLKSSKDTYINNQDNQNKYDSQYKESYVIRENFPQTSSINVLYTDQNGNLGATSDVGINNLTVFNGSNLKGGTTVVGGVSVDTLNATSITSPTITNLETKIKALEDKITNLTSNALMKSGGTINGSLTVTGKITGLNNLEVSNGDNQIATIFMPTLAISSIPGHDAFRISSRINVDNKVAPGWYTDIAYGWNGGRRI